MKNLDVIPTSEFEAGLDEYLDKFYPEITAEDVIPNIRKKEKKQMKQINLLHANKVVDAYIAIADDRLSPAQIRRNNRKACIRNKREVSEEKFVGVYV